MSDAVDTSESPATETSRISDGSPANDGTNHAAEGAQHPQQQRRNPPQQEPSSAAVPVGNGTAARRVFSRHVRGNNRGVTIQINRSTGAATIHNHGNHQQNGHIHMVRRRVNGNGNVPQQQQQRRQVQGPVFPLVGNRTVPRQQQQQHPTISPLVPQPVEFKSPIVSNETTATTATTCPICLDLVSDPVSCGNNGCDVCFCNKCLAKVQVSNKCPCCRGDLSNITKSDSLRKEMESLEVTCPHCDSSMLARDWNKHESLECPKFQFFCRFKEWGCDWMGPRDALQQHEASDCFLYKIKGLVKQVRQDRIVANNTVQALQQQLNAETQRTNHFMLHTVPRMTPHKTCGNVLDVLNAVYVSTCMPAPFRIHKDTLWRNMHSTPKARATITNFLTIVPTILLCIKISAFGFIKFISLFHTTPGDTVDACLEILYSACIAALGFMSVLSFFVDGDSMGWQRHARFSLRGMPQPALQYSVAISMWAIHLISLEWNGASAIIVWFLLLMATTILPAVVATHLAAINENSNGTTETTPQTVLENCRAPLVVLFGLRYALVVHYCGIIPCLDAVLLCAILFKAFPSFWKDRLFVLDQTMLDSVLKHTKPEYAMAMAVVQVAVLLVEEKLRLHDDNSTMLQGTALTGLVAFWNLFWTDLLVNKLLKVGITVGKLVVKSSVSDFQQRPMGVFIRREHCPAGIIAFVSWLACLGAIVIS